jgi:SAM-dependent methyltransferase
MTHNDDRATWQEGGQAHAADWRTAEHGAVPRRIVTGDDTLSADAAFRLASQGTAILWQGDFHNGKQLLQALARRVDEHMGPRSRRGAKKRPASGRAGQDAADASAAHGDDSTLAPRELFNRHRMRQSQRAQLLNRLLVKVAPATDAAHKPPVLALRRAPDISQACVAAIGPVRAPLLIPLRALLGYIGAWEWRKKGVPVPGLSGNIHVYYGVFSPNRGEYLDLLAQAPLPSTRLAFDIGTGSGVLAAMLATRGVKQVVATDQYERALACAQDNMARLGLEDAVRIVRADLFPSGRSPLVVCNPPWLPARPTTPIEHALYDPDSRMLLGFLRGLGEHLEDEGEGWLIMSDLAEHLGLRAPGFLAQAFAEAGLEVAGRLDARPRHPKAQDAADPLHAARRAEVTSLWRLKRR